MKLLFIMLIALFMLSGCYTGLGINSSIPIGNMGSIGTGVTVGSDGKVHGNIGLGGRIF